MYIYIYKIKAHLQTEFGRAQGLKPTKEALRLCEVGIPGICSDYDG